jgi:putative membrane protein
MIVNKQISGYRTIISLWRPLSLTLLWSVVVAVVHWRIPQGLLWMSPLPVTVAGVALSVLLAFRNNAGYDRYWEARGLWGRLVNASRTFVRQLVSFVPTESADSGAAGDEAREKAAFVRDMTYRIIAFAHALRHHLRQEDSFLELMRLLSAEDVAYLRRARNVPAGILMLMGEQVALARRRGWLDSILIASLDQTLTEFATIQGSCERIRNTPLPPVYSDIGHKIVLVFCALLPFGLVGDLGPIMPPAVLTIAFTFLLISRISQLLENPFGLRPNDLPLSTLSRVIEIDLRNALGEDDLPSPLQPEAGILL